MTPHARCAARPRRSIAIAALGVLLAVPIAAQVRDAGRQTRPAASTASISGVVTGDAPDSRIRRAVVTLVGSDTPSTRSVVTDDDGRFAFLGLPEGRYTVVATKAAYLPSAYGATRPGRPGIAIQLGRDQQIPLSIRLTRGAVLEGTLRDESGAPLSNMSVYALDAVDPGGIGPFESSGQHRVVTDDRGVYRFFGLAPGRYVLAATMTVIGDGAMGRRTDVEMDALLSALAATPPGAPLAGRAGVVPPITVGYAPTYFPGTAVLDDATTIALGPGDERLGLDFVVGVVRTGTIDGTLVVPDGYSAERVKLSLVIDGPRMFAPSSHPVLVQPPAPDGGFRYASVPPGHYRLLARVDAPDTDQAIATGAGTGSSRAQAGRTLFGAADVTTGGETLSGVAIALRPGITITGRVRFDSASGARPADPSQVTIRLSTPDGPAYMSSYGDGTVVGTALFASGSTNVRDDGTFALSTVAPTTYALQVTPPGDVAKTWWLRSAMFEGRDLLDEPLTVDTRDVAGVELTFTDRRNVLSGSLATAAGLPAPEYFIVVVPADRRPWHDGSRRFAFTRPASDGRFRIQDLPAGQYFLAALTDFEPGDFANDDFVAQFATQSVTVTIRDGEETTQAIRIAR
jgi:uncharacterized protein (DUF2141 family)